MNTVTLALMCLGAIPMPKIYTSPPATNSERPTPEKMEVRRKNIIKFMRRAGCPVTRSQIMAHNGSSDSTCRTDIEVLKKARLIVAERDGAIWTFTVSK